MAHRKTKPALGFFGSFLLCGWGAYRLLTESFDSYTWLIPALFAVTGGIGIAANAIHFFRNRSYESHGK
ncbi:hypothetical protein [Alteribacillus bidgolensis]|uniref:Uncharacterized protein n=1 Tax=Alteribacillus bidgolensis TaxID=930129 RepID=A0A1G8JDC6_9BACI|nr:hypothetical protein [Alteribacillus bidgolensis]SDI29091.1 hypothetical protein SAMN05216352_106151 [Alteribacillus bidgolensis]